MSTRCAALVQRATGAARHKIYYHALVHRPIICQRQAGIVLPITIAKGRQCLTALCFCREIKSASAAGNAVDALVIFAIIARAIATSLGFATLQIARGFDIVMGFAKQFNSWVCDHGCDHPVLSAIQHLRAAPGHYSHRQPEYRAILFRFWFCLCTVDLWGQRLTITAQWGQYFVIFISLSLFFMTPLRKRLG